MGKKLRAIFLLLGGVIAFAVIAFVWCASRTAPPPNISLIFLGYTNDSKGHVIATFGLTNLSDFDVGIFHGVPFETQDVTATNGVRRLDDPVLGEGYGYRTLKAHTSRTLYRMVAEPMEAPWRLPVPILPETGAMGKIKDEVGGWFENFNLKPPFRCDVYPLYTPWITQLPTNQPAVKILTP